MSEGGSGASPLTPEEEAVARLLAEAGGPEPMPAEVAARLDGVLEELRAERAEGTAPGTVPASAEVVELRARRRWPRVLLAAAAVVVGGYTVGTVASQGTLSGSESGATAASDSAGGTTDGLLQDRGDDRDRAGLPEGPEEESLSAREAPADSSAPEAAGGSSQTMVVLVRLRSDRFDTGARRAVRLLDSAPSGQPYDQTEVPDCPPPGLGSGERSLPVRYDGTAAVLVVGPERGGSVEVTVYDCAGTELDSALVRP